MSASATGNLTTDPPEPARPGPSRRPVPRMGLKGQMMSVAREFGFDPLRTIRAAGSLGRHRRNRSRLRAEGGEHLAEFPFGRWYPCLNDHSDKSGVAKGHYFHMDLHVAQRIFELKPRRHIDVGSRVDGFVAHVASYRAIEVLDIRPLETSARDITFLQADLMAGPGEFAGSTDSLSCLHTLEHFGLGRYGDPVDAGGHLKGWRSLYDILEPGGTLHFAVPMGPQRIEFDAHRVFSMRYLLERMIDPLYDVAGFAYVNDAGELVAGIDPRAPGWEGDFGCRFGCAIFELVVRDG